MLYLRLASTFSARCRRLNESLRYCHDVRPFVRPSICVGRASILIITVHASADLSLRLNSPMFWTPGHQRMSTYSQLSFSSSTWNRGGLWMCKPGLEVTTDIDKYVAVRIGKFNGRMLYTGMTGLRLD